MELREERVTSTHTLTFVHDRVILHEGAERSGIAIKLLIRRTNEWDTHTGTVIFVVPVVSMG